MTDDDVDRIAQLGRKMLAADDRQRAVTQAKLWDRLNAVEAKALKTQRERDPYAWISDPRSDPVWAMLE